MASTYIDRTHRDHGAPTELLAEVINTKSKRDGSVVIPAFGFERAQELMYHLSQLVHDDAIPNLPIYLDSPMAVNLTDVFREYRLYFDEQTKKLYESDHPPLHSPGLKLSRNTNES